ncbi:acetamidase/formamidase family protein [Tunturiibacter gelidiferens]|uniref:acetamidase/formamidase family protein n=1 Tax=Tunturiibacter gelidiferens TaxID=3069689 RepID=UPI003D9B3FCD
MIYKIHARQPNPPRHPVRRTPNPPRRRTAAAHPPRHSHHRSLGLLLRQSHSRPHHPLRRHRHHPNPLHLRLPRAPKIPRHRPLRHSPYVEDIYKNYPASEKGPGGHILTGPVAITEAEPGDVLEVRIQKISIDVPWACNGFGPGRGFLPNDFPYSRTRIIPLDREKMIGHFAPGIDIPLHPFFGSMGIAPPESAGKYNSAPPWMHAGNIDNKEMVAGTTLYIPVNAKGALFEAGDGHAGQGNGEVDITALETQLTGTFQFIVHKDQHLLWPRGETPTAYIAMGFDEDLKTATEMAVRNMITFLSEEIPDQIPGHPRLTRDEAYALISTACDVDITQLVDTKSGVHVLCPRKLFIEGSNNH